MLPLFLEGKRTDIVIRVRIIGMEQQQQQQPAPPTTKLWQLTKTYAAAAAAAAFADRYTDIKAHSLVLSACSAYFDKCLSGDWADATTRRVELTVADEQ